MSETPERIERAQQRARSKVEEATCDTLYPPDVPEEVTNWTGFRAALDDALELAEAVGAWHEHNNERDCAHTNCHAVRGLLAVLERIEGRDA